MIAFRPKGREILENYDKNVDGQRTLLLKACESLEGFAKEKLMEIVENGLDIELIEDAMQKLSHIDEKYALAKGIEFLKNDSFDPYFQTCIFDFIYDLDKEAVLDCISSRTSDIDFYLYQGYSGNDDDFHDIRRFHQNEKPCGIFKLSAHAV